MSWVNWLQRSSIIQIYGLDVQINMTQAGQFVRCGAKNIDINFGVETTDDSIMGLTTIDMKEYCMETSVAIDNTKRRGRILASKRWISLDGNLCTIIMSVNLATKMKAIKCSMDNNTCDVQLESFLQLYKDYQNAEDYAFEIKLLHKSSINAPSIEKMEIEMIKTSVILRDIRCDLPQYMILENLIARTSKRLLIIEDDEGDITESPIKEMYVNLSGVEKYCRQFIK